MTTSQPRQPKGQPVGGQFAGKQQTGDEVGSLKTESGVFNPLEVEVDLGSWDDNDNLITKETVTFDLRRALAKLSPEERDEIANDFTDYGFDEWLGDIVQEWAEEELDHEGPTSSHSMDYQEVREWIAAAGDKRAKISDFYGEADFYYRSKELNNRISALESRKDRLARLQLAYEISKTFPDVSRVEFGGGEGITAHAYDHDGNKLPDSVNSEIRYLAVNSGQFRAFASNTIVHVADWGKN